MGVLRSIASGLLGAEAQRGGVATAAFEVLLHFIISFGVARDLELENLRAVRLLADNLCGDTLWQKCVGEFRRHFPNNPLICLAAQPVPAPCPAGWLRPSFRMKKSNLLVTLPLKTAVALRLLEGRVIPGVVGRKGLRRAVREKCLVTGPG